jgi:hypothetical protein
MQYVVWSIVDAKAVDWIGQSLAHGKKLEHIIAGDNVGERQGEGPRKGNVGANQGQWSR